MVEYPLYYQQKVTPLSNRITYIPTPKTRKLFFPLTFLHKAKENDCDINFLHNIYHFNFTVCFKNWSLQVTFKIMW